MSGVETVNDEFEVGFNQKFESHWYRAEQAGRVVMVLFTLAAALGLLGRGPFSHATARSADGALAVDYEPIARHSTATTLTVHIKKKWDVPHPIELRIDQKIIEPMGYQHTIPIPSGSSVDNNGITLTFNVAAHQPDALVRFDLSPSAVGLIPLRLSDGTETIKWSMLVMP